VGTTGGQGGVPPAGETGRTRGAGAKGASTFEQTRDGRAPVPMTRVAVVDGGVAA